MPNAQCRSSGLGASAVASHAFRFFSSDKCTRLLHPELPPPWSRTPRAFCCLPLPQVQSFLFAWAWSPKVQLAPLNLRGFGPLAPWEHLSKYLQMVAGQGMGFRKGRAFLEKLWSGTFCCRPTGGHGCWRGWGAVPLPSWLAGMARAGKGDARALKSSCWVSR